MTRRVFSGGQVLDGTGSPPAARRTSRSRTAGSSRSGTGWTATRSSTAPARPCCPGLFDCHVHVMMSGVDTLRQLQTPFSYGFYEAVHNLRRTLALGITHVRDAGGADLGRGRGGAPGPDRRPADADRDQHAQPDRRARRRLARLRRRGADLSRPHPGRPATVVDGPDEMRRTVRQLLRAGADVIKVATSGGVLSARDDPRHAHFRAAGARRPGRGGERRARRGDGARAGRRGHQGRGARRHPLDRARHLPRRRGDRPDARARHLAGARR